MAYKRVYTPTGEPFDVPETRANDLILQQGWTQQPPLIPDPVQDEEPDPVLHTESEPKSEYTPKTLRNLLNTEESDNYGEV